MPLSTASRIAPPSARVFRAASLAGLPNGQVETTNGASPPEPAAASAPYTECMAAPPKSPSAEWPRNLRRETFIRGCGYCVGELSRLWLHEASRKRNLVQCPLNPLDYEETTNGHE